VINPRNPAGMQGGTAKEKLGEILVREGWITAEQRD
jgi:hypothetical protein